MPDPTSLSLPNATRRIWYRRIKGYSMGPIWKALIRGALNAGRTRQQVVEVAMQMAIYAGFPAAISAMGSVRETFAELDVGAEKP